MTLSSSSSRSSKEEAAMSADRAPFLVMERAAALKLRGYIIPLTFGRARIVADVPGGMPFYESEFW